MWPFVSGFFHLDYISMVHHCDGTFLFFLFYGQVVLHCLKIPHFAYLFTDWWLFGLFLPLACYEYMLLWALMYKVLMYICLQFSWVDRYLGMELLGYVVILCLIFWGTARLFCKVYMPFNISLTKCSNLSTSLPTFVIFYHFNYSHLRRYEGVYVFWF